MEDLDLDLDLDLNNENVQSPSKIIRGLAKTVLQEKKSPSILNTGDFAERMSEAEAVLTNAEG